MNLLLSFHCALIQMLPSLLLDRRSRTLSRTGPTTGITLFVEKTALNIRSPTLSRTSTSTTAHRTPQLGTLGLNPLITTRIFVDRMTSTPLSKVDQMRTFEFRYVCLYVCTYSLLCVLQHLSVCVCLTVCSPDVIFIHLVCP